MLLPKADRANNMAWALLNVDDLSSLNGQVYIYGSGSQSQSFAAEFERHTSKSISGYLTSFQAYETTFAKVHNIDEHWSIINKPEVTIVVITQYSREIINSLHKKSLKAQLFNGIHYVFPFLGVFNENEESNLLSSAHIIEARLHSTRSKKLYNELIKYRTQKVISAGIENIYERFNLLMDKYYGQGASYCEKHYMEYEPLDNLQTIIEGGMCFGNITVKLLPLLAKDGQLHSFDPSYDAILKSGGFNQLSEHLNEAKQSKNLFIHNKALWHKSESLYFSEDSNFSQRHISDKGTQIEAISLDEFCNTRRISSIDFIKLDIEGAEPNFIRGAMSTILRYRPSLAISIYHGSNQIVSIPELLMNKLSNYRFEIGHHSNSPWLETVLYAIPEEI